LNACRHHLKKPLPGKSLLWLPFAAVLLQALLSCSGPHNLPAPGERYARVPEAYRTLYRRLETRLEKARRRVAALPRSGPDTTAFGAELLVANSNRGKALLSRRTLEATILTLDRLQALGVRCVALSIQYPVLVPSFPDYSKYLAFYREVVRRIRRRNLTLVVEIGTTFREPEFADLKVDYRNLTPARFRAELRQMAASIVEHLQPDYLTLFTEPDTQSRNTGLEFTVPEFAAAVRRAAAGLSRRGLHLGAGAGTWSSMQYFAALADIPELDYIDLHIYPIQRDFLADKVLRVAALARRRGKSVSIGEAWLYKVADRELGRISPVRVYARDVYSFWQPLDQAFLEVVVGLAQRVRAEFCSFFWMKYFYGYLDYNSKTRRLSPGRLLSASSAVAGRNILNGTLSSTGEKFKTLIAPERY